MSSQDLSVQEKSLIVDELANAAQRNIPLAYAPSGETMPDDVIPAYNAFLRDFPGGVPSLTLNRNYADVLVEYRLTWMLDTLRKSDFSRLERSGETYVDYMGGSLYPESLIRVHTDFLNRSILGNTHSVSNR